MELYVKAESKKEANEKLTQGKRVFGDNYSMFGSGGTYELNAELANGTSIKIYSKFSGGNPIAKSYGTWDNKKLKIK